MEQVSLWMEEELDRFKRKSELALSLSDLAGSSSGRRPLRICVFNSICPQLEIDNGIFHRSDQVLLLAKSVVKECVSISKVAGVQLSEAEIIESILQISKISDVNLFPHFKTSGINSRLRLKP